ncbi:hypothetical protein HYH03_008384 [Edaphochlamys debaryana]|uniref:Protein preY, mitochondrial n=1 Tax=Edaphochlamys debaryana TaxID=47281 RepID=A0A835XZT1_9CHLO|nr:hypothetical protein HYH03_008384 [Edaphochlamys debaryana]|eukprot:KAG2493246.1 hypothetical protein HYH03_008384 [Edaphochlamys debaryana]
MLRCTAGRLRGPATRLWSSPASLSSSAAPGQTAAEEKRPDPKVPAGTPPEVAKLLPFIACPLTKAPLRYDPTSQRLVCDELGVAYGISAEGVPQLLPQLGELLD